jgi:hypothetical protein
LILKGKWELNAGASRVTKLRGAEESKGNLKDKQGKRL